MILQRGVIVPNKRIIFWEERDAVLWMGRASGRFPRCNFAPVIHQWSSLYDFLSAQQPFNEAKILVIFDYVSFSSTLFTEQNVISNQLLRLPVQI